MDGFESRLKLLLEILEQKEEILIGILNITENQETILLGMEVGSGEGNDFLRGMNEEKAGLIDQVLQFDEVFQGTFASLEDFETTAPEYKELIGTLQQGIRRVMDLDVKIRVQESRNKDIAVRQKSALKASGVSKRYILDQYAKNKGNKEKKP